VSPPTASGSRKNRASRLRRAATGTLLWAGPLGLALAALLLLVSEPFFRPGPGVPTAGDGRAWNAIWAAFGFLALGCVVGIVANLAWLTRAFLARRRPTTIEWTRTLLGVTLGVAFAALWFRS
jgi:uncharacterized membrane protein